MSVYFSASSAVNMNNSPVFSPYTAPVMTSTQFQVSETGGTKVLDFYGSFTYPGGAPTGTATQFTLTVGGVLTYSVSGNIDMATVANYFAAGNGTALNNYLFSGNDIFSGSSGADVLNGLGGNDSMSGNVGNDTLNGGAGDDNLEGGAGNDKLNGGTNSTPWGGDAAAYWNATAGVIVNLSLTGAQAVGGGCGTDTLIGIEGLFGSGFNDTLTGNAGNNQLQGNAGNDTLNGGAGDDNLEGGAGNDKLNGGANSTPWGGDTAGYWSATAGVTVNLSLTGAQAVGGGCGTDTLTGIEGLSGSGFNDKLTGNAGNNQLQGNAGNDTLNGGAGNDMLSGGAGTDTLNGGAGNEDGAGYWDAAGGVTVNLSLTGAQAVGGGCGTDTLTGIEQLEGSGFADKLTGNAGGNSLNGQNGNDTLNGAGGNDALSGGAGNDKINGGAGADLAIYDSDSMTSGVTVNLSLTGAQAVGGGCGTDTLTGIEGLAGSSFNDTLRGNSVSNGLTVSDNWLIGQAGADTIIGGAGNESIVGDMPLSLLGFADIPTTTAWGGKDTLTGGGGADSFVFASLFDSTVGANRDVIKDFVRGTDKIDLSAMDAQTAAGTANDAFTFITGTSFTAAGQVRFANGILYGNTDADATAEFEIALTGITTLAATDLVL